MTVRLLRAGAWDTARLKTFSSMRLASICHGMIPDPRAASAKARQRAGRTGGGEVVV
jgi:hypothetical protein